jgi:hypothetical protein
MFERLDDVLAVALREIRDARVQRSNETPYALGGRTAGAAAHVQKCLKGHSDDI